MRGAAPACDARPLKRVLQRVQQPLARQPRVGEVRDGIQLPADIAAGHLSIKKAEVTLAA